MPTTHSRSAVALVNVAIVIGAIAGLMPSRAAAQELQYTWVDISFQQQEASKTIVNVNPDFNQTVTLNTSDGDGIRFRGSLGEWNNFFAFFDWGSSEPDVDVVVSNDQGDFPASDVFDLTVVRAGFGYRYPVSARTDIYGQVSYDSIDYDFGSFAGEQTDIDFQDVGVALGVRAMLTDRFEARAQARFSGSAKVDLTNREASGDTLFEVGFGFTLIRGLMITGGYETGDINTFTLGFRLDLDED